MSALEWEDGPYGGERGFLQVGAQRLRLASVSWSVVRSDPHPWVLSTEIPGYKAGRHFATQEDAHAAADKLLAAFVRHAQKALGEHSSNPREDA